MENTEREKYLKAYYENEADANKHMAYANVFAAIIMTVFWVLYIFKVLTVNDSIYVLINIIFPIGISILVSPIFYIKTTKILKPRFKYFVVFSFILVAAALNIIIPKHATLLWALSILIVTHYYNPKLGLFAFISILTLMFFCLYGGALLGEYDPNLLGPGVIQDGKIIFPESTVDRYNMLHQMLLEGENRYLKIFLFYYLPRAAILTLIFFVINALNRRTYNLLVKELKVSSDNQKTKTELEVAKEIQLATLPIEFVTNEDVEIQAELKPAKEVGGDFYDYFVLDDDHVAILIADVSGKGIPAAMFMMKTITCFKNYVSLKKSPAETLKEVNKIIYQGNDSKMFVTCFYAIVNTETGVMRYANAGHNPPVIGQFGSYHYLKCNSGFVLGGLSEAFVKDEETQLNNGDTITLYTDGITEARNEKGEFYGNDRMINLYNKREYSCLVELHHSLKDDVEKFANGAVQSDDMTYITLKYHGDKCEYEEQEFAPKIEKIPEMLEFLRLFAEKMNIEKSFINNLLVVADELLSNSIKYGCEENNEKIFMRILYNLERKEFILTIIDHGKEFNPFLTNNQPLEGDISNKKEGGLGILIVKKLMSEYAHDYINKKNILILKKKF